jgi:membrane-bound lytic murein transglycosylase D
MWQFMSGTALENGLQHDWYIDERAEPEKATRAAAKYLKTLHSMFGDWHLALASYNGGPGRVQRAIKRTGGTDFWKMSASSRYLPRETRDYVPLILASVIIARNPAQYGMNIQPFDAPPAFEKVTLPEAVDIRRVAEWAGTSVETIQDLNPELRRWTTPMRTKDYELKVPQGTAELVQTRLAEASPEELAPLQWHTVRKGETLTSISRKLSVSRADLAAANYMSVKTGVKPGQQLVIPRAPALLLAARADTAPPLTESRSLDPLLASNSSTAIPENLADTVSSALPEKSAQSTSQSGKSGQSKLVYLVKRGDTLFSIAKLYRTTVDSLKSWNRMRGSALQIGQRLTIFTTRPPLAGD